MRCFSRGLIVVCDDFPVGSLFGGKSFLRDDLPVGCFFSGLVFPWVERAVELLDCRKIFVLYIIRDVAAILIIGSSTQVALTCGFLLLSLVVCFLIRLLRMLPNMCAVSHVE